MHDAYVYVYDFTNAWFHYLFGCIHLFDLVIHECSVAIRCRRPLCKVTEVVISFLTRHRFLCLFLLPHIWCILLTCAASFSVSLLFL